MADRLDEVAGRVARIEHRIDRVDAGVRQLAASVDRRLDEMAARFGNGACAQLMEAMHAGLAQMTDRVDRLERKLDGFIEVQMQTNQLVERRLEILESR
jgi:hypothetical protein